MRLEARRAAGLSPRVSSVASVFVSRWDKAVMGKLPEGSENQLGMAVAQRTYKAYRDLLASDRWQRLANLGVRPQRLLWASTGTKDPRASDTLYITALAAPHTINTISEATLHAFADHGEVGALLPADGGDTEEVLEKLARAGVDYAGLAAQLQRDGTRSFDDSWDDLLGCLASKAESTRVVR